MTGQGEAGGEKRGPRGQRTSGGGRGNMELPNDQLDPGDIYWC